MSLNLRRKILFINSNMEKNPWPVVPLGLCLVASNLKDHEKKFLDLTFKKSPKKVIAKTLIRFEPDFVCVGIRNIDNTNYDRPHFYLRQIKSEVIDTIRNGSPAVIIAGGSAINVNPAGVIDYLGVDYGIYGEGEESLGRLISAIIQNVSLSEVEGAIFREGENIRVNPAARIKNLDGMSASNAAKWINLRNYANLTGRINIQTKRGCSLRCTYCTYNQIEGNRVRLRSPKKVVDEIEEVIKKTGIKDIEFTDSVFNRPSDHAMEICKEIIRRRVKANFSTMGINPGYISPEFISLLEEAGFNEISVTPESVSQTVIDGLNKGFKKHQVIEAARLLARSKLNVIWYFMFGGPGETRETVEETIDFIKNNIPRKHLVICVSAIRIFKGTQLEKIAIKEGQINENTNFLKPVFYCSNDVEPEYIQSRIRWTTTNLPNCLPLEDIKIRGIKKLILGLTYMYLKLTRNSNPMWVYIIKMNNLKRRA